MVSLIASRNDGLDESYEGVYPAQYDVPSGLYKCPDEGKIVMSGRRLDYSPDGDAEKGERKDENRKDD